MKILNTLDLTKNQIINVVLDKKTSYPPPIIEGQIYYNETSDKVYFYDGIFWVDVNYCVSNNFRCNNWWNIYKSNTTKQKK